MRVTHAQCVRVESTEGLVLAEAIAIDNVQFLCSFQVPDLSDADFEGSETESRPITTPSEAKRKLGAPTSHTPKLSDAQSRRELTGGSGRCACV